MIYYFIPSNMAIFIANLSIIHSKTISFEMQNYLWYIFFVALIRLMARHKLNATNQVHSDRSCIIFLRPFVYTHFYCCRFNIFSRFVYNKCNKRQFFFYKFHFLSASTNIFVPVIPNRKPHQAFIAMLPLTGSRGVIPTKPQPHSYRMFFFHSQPLLDRFVCETDNKASKQKINLKRAQIENEKEIIKKKSDFLYWRCVVFGLVSYFSLLFLCAHQTFFLFLIILPINKIDKPAAWLEKNIVRVCQQCTASF